MKNFPSVYPARVRFVLLGTHSAKTPSRVTHRVHVQEKKWQKLYRQIWPGLKFTCKLLKYGKHGTDICLLRWVWKEKKREISMIMVKKKILENFASQGTWQGPEKIPFGPNVTVIYIGPLYYYRVHCYIPSRSQSDQRVVLFYTPSLYREPLITLLNFLKINFVNLKPPII